MIRFITNQTCRFQVDAPSAGAVQELFSEIGPTRFDGFVLEGYPQMVTIAAVLIHGKSWYILIYILIYSRFLGVPYFQTNPYLGSPTFRCSNFCFHGSSNSFGYTSHSRSFLLSPSNAPRNGPRNFRPSSYRQKVHGCFPSSVGYGVQHISFVKIRVWPRVTTD